MCVLEGGGECARAYSYDDFKHFFALFLRETKNQQCGNFPFTFSIDVYCVLQILSVSGIDAHFPCRLPV